MFLDLTIKPVRVYKIKLDVPITWGWNGNPLAKKFITPNVDGLDDDGNLKDLFITIDKCHQIYWWQIKYIEIWEKGELILRREDFPSPRSDYGCDF